MYSEGLHKKQDLLKKKKPSYADKYNWYELEEKIKWKKK